MSTSYNDDSVMNKVRNDTNDSDNDEDVVSHSNTNTNSNIMTDFIVE